MHLHGDAGIGKSALTAVLLDRSRAKAAATVKLDCRSIEPTERGLLEALATATRSDEQGVDASVARLGSLGGTVVLTLDHFEVLRLMDTWLRQVLVPALDEHVRVLLVGREAPVAAWFSAGWEGLFRSVALGPLVDDEAELLLTGRGHPSDEAWRLNRIARGHPLALTLASAAARERPDLVLEEAATTRVVTELLSEVWGYEFTGGSNVVDAAVRSLRHKLGDAAVVVETVRGAGYRVPEEWRTLVA